MKTVINIFVLFSLFSCSNNESSKLIGTWTGNLIYGVEEVTPFDSSSTVSDSSLTLEQQLGELKYYERIVHDSIVFITKQDSIFTNAGTGEFMSYLIMESEEANELSLFNPMSIINFKIIRLDKDSLIFEPTIKPIIFGGQVDIVKTEYKLRRK